MGWRCWTLVLVLLAVSPAAAVSPLDAPRALATAVDAVQRGRCEPFVGDLQRLAGERTPTGARAAFLLGHCLRQLRRFDAAREAFLDAADRHTTLRGYARYFAASVSLALGDAAGAVRLLEPSLTPTSTAFTQRADLLRGEALLHAGRPSAALAVLRRLTPADLDDAASVRAWWLLGQAAEASGDRGTARRAYAMVWWGMPANPLAPAAESRLRKLAGGANPTPSAEARLARAERLVAAADDAAAKREFARALHQGLRPEDAAHAWYHLGLLQLGTPEAVYAFRQSSQAGPDADRGLFWWGTALGRVGRSAEGRAVWARLLGQYPASPWSARALLALGLRAEGARRPQEAEQWYRYLAQQHSASRSADEARWRLGWLRYRAHRYAEAERRWLRSAEAFPSTPRAAAHLYWAARARQQQGRSGAVLLRAVASRYPLTFYGQRARARLGLGPPVHAQAAAVGPLPEESFAAAYAELAALGFPREAAGEADALRENSPSASLTRDAAILHARGSDISQSVSAAEQLVVPGLYGAARADADLWQLAYPRAFSPQVAQASGSNGVPSGLVYAVMREESRFDPRAVSPAGAIGVMQLLSSTARGVLGAPVGPVQLMDPTVNISAGVRYLGGLLRRFGGSVPLAVAAYNAGPGAAQRTGNLARADLDLFVEGLPYAETRAYVQRVLESYGIYQWLYGSAPGTK